MKELHLRPIGVIHSPHQQAAGTPVQSSLATGISGTVEVLPEFAAGLKDLEAFDRIWLMYWFDRASPYHPTVKPYLDTVERGLFATRAPARPNPIGISAVKLLSVEGNMLTVDGMDILDGTPLLDIKPYLPAFDAVQAEKTGWCGQLQVNAVLADGRFETDSKAGSKTK